MHEQTDSLIQGARFTGRPENVAVLDLPHSRFPTDDAEIADSLLDKDLAPVEYPDADPHVVEALRRLLERRCPDDPEAGLPELTTEQAAGRARRILRGMQADEAEYRWARIELARARVVLFTRMEAGLVADTVHPSEHAASTLDPSRLANAWRDITEAAITEATHHNTTEVTHLRSK